MKFSVVIPVYGCPGALPELHARLEKVLRQLTEDYEIIFVNDACPKGSWEQIEALYAQDAHVVGINLSRNFGQMAALLAGLDQASGDWVIVMDCDLQDRPEEIVRLYEKAQEGYDVVFGRRVNGDGSQKQNWLSRCFYSVYSYATGGYYDPALCNFSISKRLVIENYCKMREYHRAFVMYIRWLGFRQAVIDVTRDKRFEGKSGYNLRKRIHLALEILTSQSDKFLRLIVGMGGVMILISVLLLLWIVIQYFTMHVPAGWSSLMAILLLTSGIVTFSVGMTGLYVGNIFLQVKERPLYVVAQTLKAAPRSSQ